MSAELSERRGSAIVLLVEDDASLRDAVVRTLTRNGFSVTPVETGAAAIETARALAPDVVVIDVLLPDAGGLGVAREIRKQSPKLGAVPILFITALSLPTVRDLLAPTPVLFKPFTQRQILTSISEVMGR
jgi:CheY-like chemotaxis protein